MISSLSLARASSYKGIRNGARVHDRSFRVEPEDMVLEPEDMVLEPEDMVSEPEDMVVMRLYCHLLGLGVLSISNPISHFPSLSPSPWTWSSSLTIHICSVKFLYLDI